MSRARSILFAVAAVATSPALAADPAYVGTWGVSALQCKVPQDRRGAPMIVTLKGYDQHETHCSFRQVRRSGGGWRVRAACAVEGDQQVHAFAMKVTGDVLTVTEGKVARAYRRCR